ncbi:MAG: hypothetical protein EXX96DRAFT_563912 [Benjaminiella poitrasii]|nr:MAG: hypothetical protein EXX96DRAFT_563912 [Benjaminiella poitrasii]
MDLIDTTLIQVSSLEVSTTIDALLASSTFTTFEQETTSLINLLSDVPITTNTATLAMETESNILHSVPSNTLDDDNYLESAPTPNPEKDQIQEELTDIPFSTQKISSTAFSNANNGNSFYSDGNSSPTKTVSSATSSFECTMGLTTSSSEGCINNSVPPVVDNNSPLSEAQITGLIIGPILAFFTFVALLCICLRIRRRKIKANQRVASFILFNNTNNQKNNSMLADTANEYNNALNIQVGYSNNNNNYSYPLMNNTSYDVEKNINHTKPHGNNNYSAHLFNMRENNTVIPPATPLFPYIKRSNTEVSNSSLPYKNINTASIRLLNNQLSSHVNETSPNRASVNSNTDTNSLSSRHMSRLSNQTYQYNSIIASSNCRKTFSINQLNKELLAGSQNMNSSRNQYRPSVVFRYNSCQSSVIEDTSQATDYTRRDFNSKQPDHMLLWDDNLK